MPAKALCESRDCRRRAKTQNRKRTCSEGLMLCPACRDRTYARLEELPGLYEDCGNIILRSPDSRMEKVSRLAAARPAFNEAAIEARSDIVSLLASWAAMVADERQCTKPDRRDVPFLVKFLIRHQEWLLAHSVATDFADELAETVDRARRASRPNPGRHLELGNCVEEGCGERLSVTRDVKGGHPVRIQCGAGHAWHPSDWLILAQRLRSAPAS